MVNAIELLRNLAGVLFWAGVDLILGGLWAALIFGIVQSVFKRNKSK